LRILVVRGRALWLWPRNQRLKRAHLFGSGSERALGVCRISAPFST